jgi:hypothetical protein
MSVSVFDTPSLLSTYMESCLRIGSVAHDEKKSHLVLERAYGLGHDQCFVCVCGQMHMMKENLTLVVCRLPIGYIISISVSRIWG